MKWATRRHRDDLREQSRSDWHRWFAWRPVVVNTGEGSQYWEYWVWLEVVERKWGTSRYSGQQKWRYRPAESDRDCDRQEQTRRRRA